ncbi:hypothetical protein ACFLXB_08410 [Chloroflexota bacterium]
MANQNSTRLIEKAIIKTSLFYGVIIGFTYALVYWGYDSLILMNSHVAYAWLQFIIGAICSILIFSLAALLTYLANKSWAGLVFWVLAARLVAELTIAIPLKIVPFIMKLFEPEIAVWIPAHTYSSTTDTWITIAFIGLAIFSGILGLLQIVLVEQAAEAQAQFSQIMPFILSIIIILIGSVMVINLVSERLQPAMVAVDDLISFTIDNKGVEIDPALAREMHYGAIRGVIEHVNTPYRLFLGDYDRTFTQIDIIIDFHGKWITCNTVGGNITYCKLSKVVPSNWNDGMAAIIPYS